MTTPTPAQALQGAANGASFYGSADCLNEAPQIAAAVLHAAAEQMIKTDGLLDTAEDIIRRAELHHQAGWLCTMAADLEGNNA